jgi:hypothetical protein
MTAERTKEQLEEEVQFLKQLVRKAFFEGLRGCSNYSVDLDEATALWCTSNTWSVLSGLSKRGTSGDR